MKKNPQQQNTVKSQQTVYKKRDYIPEYKISK